MKFFVVLVVVVVACNAHSLVKRGNGDQNPKVWDALKVLRGGKDLTIPDILSILSSAVAGKDYPINSAVGADPNCKQINGGKPGFYADTSSPSECQIFHRCDENVPVTSYLCPNMTLFNQITLICDWFYNVDCAVSAKFQDYSNSRLYQEGLLLLDDQDVIASTGAQ